MNRSICKSVIIALVLSICTRCICSGKLYADGSDYQTLLKAYQAEREIVAKKSSAQSLVQSDELVKQAEAVSKNKPELAERLIRDARWRLPYIPDNLPENVSQVFGTMRARHSDRVNAMVYISKNLLASASKDGLVNLWDLGNGSKKWSYEKLGEIKPESDKLQDDVLKAASLVYSEKADLLAAGGYNEIHLIEPKTGKFVKALKGHKGTVKGIAFSNDGKRLVSMADDRLLKIWNIEKAQELSSTDLSKEAGGSNNPLGRFEAIAYSPKVDQIALGNIDGRMLVYDVSEAKPKLKLAAVVMTTAIAVLTLKYTPDGTGIISAGDRTGEKNMSVRWTAAPLQDAPLANPVAGVLPPVRTYPTNLDAASAHTQQVNSLGVSPNGQLLVTGSSDKTIRIWEMNSSKLLKQFSFSTEEVTSIAISADGSEVAAGNEVGQIRFWKLTSDDEHTKSNETKEMLNCVAISPDGNRHAAAGKDQTIRIYDSEGNVLKTLKGHKTSVNSMVFIDNNKLASGGDRDIYIWNVDKEEDPKILKGHSSVVLALVLSSDGKTLYSASLDRTMKAWDIEAGQQSASFSAQSAVCCLSVLGNQAVIGCADGWITILKLSEKSIEETGNMVAHIQGVAGVAISPKGGMITTVGGDGLTKFWNIDDKSRIRFDSSAEVALNSTTQIASSLTAVAYSSDGRYLVTGGQDGLIRFYEIETEVIKNLADSKNNTNQTKTRSPSRNLRGNTDWIMGLAFSRDNNELLSVGADQTLRRFSLTTTRSVVHYGHLGSLNFVVLTPDQKQLVTFGKDSWKLWDAESGSVIKTFENPSFDMNTLQFLSDKEILLAGGARSIGTYSVQTGERLRGDNVSGNNVFSVATNGKTISIWQSLADHSEFIQIKEGKLTEPIKLPGDKEAKIKITCAALTNDCRLGFAAQADQNVQVIDLATRKLVKGLWPLFDASPVDIVTTANGERVVCIDEKGQIKVANVEERKVTATVKAHESAGCKGLWLSKSGERFISIGTDNQIIAWDMNCKELRSWKFSVGLNSISISNDGKKIYTANSDGSIYVLDLP
jgi:WD40 repeat protein